MKFINQLTQPFGIKLFKGGPYEGRDQVYAARDIYGRLQGIGSKMLGLESPEGDGGVQNLSDMLTGMSKRLSDVAGGTGGYSLRPAQQQQLNQSVGTIEQKRRSAIAQAKQRLAARGITGPAYEAALQRINEAYDEMGMRQSSDYTEGARTQHISELGTLLQQLLGMHQYGTGLLSGAAQGRMGVGAAEAQASDAAMGRLGSLLGMVFGMGGFNSVLPAHMRQTNKQSELSEQMKELLNILRGNSTPPTVPIGTGQTNPYISVPPIRLGGYPNLRGHLLDPWYYGR